MSTVIERNKNEIEGEGRGGGAGRLSKFQGQNAVGAGISSEVENPVPPTLKQAWLVGATGLLGAAEAVSRQNRRTTGTGTVG